MGRFYRHRSSSGGSYSDMKTSNNTVDDAAAQELVQILLNLVNATSGKSFLHTLDSTPASINMAHALLLRASVLQDSSLQQSLLQQRDVESGYTPLHWAVKHGHLSAVLLLLRQAQGRLVRRPMELLGEAKDKDYEGMTPLQLLGMLQQGSLRTCRQDLSRRHDVTTSVAPSMPNNFVDDEQHELALLNANMHLLQVQTEQQETTATNTATACEVVTFGRAHHVALGVPYSDATHPRRVSEFGLDRRDELHGSAVVVAAAKYHSLVVTSSGKLYSCGLGKGGRLGSGKELECPLFSLVGISKTIPALKRKVVHAAAAENHSLCVTSDGAVYAFGSNRFGQLGIRDKGQCFTPRRVEDLKCQQIQKVAAGDKHSMALTREGQVYTWGDNQAGQLGTRRSTGKVQLVESLWNAIPHKVCTAICASEHSSLILTKPTANCLPINAVYQWGHGNHVPIKVNFTSTADQRHVNPVDIACAKYHNAAVTQDGHVYTWGLHSEPLGNTSQQSSMVIASPQLVEGMLPEHGGGIAVAVSAAEHHTAVVTDCGHLYTWGATFGKNVLGHEGVRWQPSPKKVDGVHRAVAVAAAKEHNVVLMGTNFPEMPAAVSSLETLAARQVAKHVDLFNVIPILITAERAECTFLKDYCNEFIKFNLDGVLCLGRKSEMDCFLNEQLAAGFDKMDRDVECHPLVYDVIMAGSTSSVKEFDSLAWMEACKSLLERLPVSTLVKYRQSVSNGNGTGSEVSRRTLRRSRTLSIHDDDTGEQTPGECSERCLMLTANMDVKTCDAAQSKVDNLSKEVRSVKKLLNQIAKLQLAESLTPEQQQKVQRRLLLETDLAILEPALVNVEEKLRELTLKQEARLPWSMEAVTEEDSVKEFGTPESTSTAVDADEFVKEFDDDAPENDTVEADVQVFRCDLCSISCPDANNLALHKNGRKHRNRVMQAEEEEQKKVAASILEDKRRQMMLSDNATRPSVPATVEKKMSPWDKPAQTEQPRYRLPPPPHFPSLGEAATKTSLPAQPPKATWNKTLTLSTKAAPKTTGLAGSFQTQRKKNVMTSTGPAPTKYLSPGSIPALASPPWASPAARVPVASASGFPSSSPKEESKKTYSLGDFLYSPSPPVEKATPAPWSPKAVASKAPTPNCKSFMDIQQEEQEIRSKEHTRVEGKWYVDQQVRAGSISAIQEAEEKEREHQLLVEEQKQIEAQIERERQQEKKKKSRNRKPRNKKKDTAGSDGAGDKSKKPAKSGGGRKRRPNNRKKSNADQKAVSSAAKTTASGS